MSHPPYIDPEAQEIFESFIVETQELLESLSHDIMLLESGAVETEILNRVFRSFHTIKGTASFMGFSNLITLIHSAEDLLNKLRRTELPVSPEIVDALFEVHDWVAILVKNPDKTTNAAGLSQTIAKLSILSQTGKADQITLKPEPENNTTLSPLEDFILNAPDNSADFTAEELSKLDAAFAEINRSLQSSNEIPGQNVLKKSAQSENSINLHEATIRVDVQRIEHLTDLSTELVLERNRLEQLIGELHDVMAGNDTVSELLKTAEQLYRITSGLQSSVTKIRMTSVGKLYQRAPRLVRDLARKFGKDIHLVLKGDKVEVDRAILEEMADPLIHLLRNACDHGIELSEEREQKGKPRYGTITLDASCLDNRIVLRIEDDGAGLDTEKLKQTAIEKRLISSDLAAEMPPEEIFQLIFAPGFSAARAVSSVSGRGVGLDVVSTNVRHLHGTVSIESEFGKGTAFIISLPLGIVDTSF